MVPGVRRDGAEVDMAPPEEVGEVEAPIVSEEALVESAPMPANAPEVGQMGGGTTEASPVEAVIARTLEPELPASSVIGGSTFEGALVTEEVPSAPVGATPTVATADPLVGAGSSRSHVRLGDDPLAWGGGWLRWARRLDPSDSVFTLDDPVEEKDWTSVRSGLESVVRSLTDALGVLKDDIALSSQVCPVFTFSTFETCFYNSNLSFLQSLVMRSREKSLFLHHEREVWGLAAEVPRLQEEVVSL